MSNESTKTALQNEIERKKNLDGLKKELVGWADKLAEKAPDNFAAQLSMAQEAAAREAEPAVLVNFLKYQAARGSVRDPGWGFNDLYQKAAEDIKTISDRCNEDSLLRQRAISLYLGYARRSYMAERLLARRRKG
jgi:hypothetical protein